MDLVLRYLAQARAIWAGMSTLYRYLAVGLLVAVILSSVAAYYFSSAAEYVPLASGLSEEEAAAIVTQLDSAAVPYRLDSSGSTILVPKDRRARIKVDLAAKGLTARGGKGYELFDDVSLGATPFVQNVNYTRALQAELARSIMQLEPVASARVLIARAEPTPFLRDQRPTTASVVLKLKPGAGVSRSMAAGIVSLVARSVEGLRPENVTVLDSAGRLLSDPRGADAEGQHTAGDLEHRRELEAYLSSRAEEFLARQLGAGRALVRVSADLNFQKLRETRESYSPEERAVRMEQTVSSESGSSGRSGGPAGAASNSSKNFVSTGHTSSSGRNREETTHVDYLVSKTTREMETRIGSIQRLTVAVLVDLTPREGAETITATDVEELVKQAVGFQSGRDEIKVTSAPLAGALPPPEPPEPSLAERAQEYVHLARNAVMVVAFAFLAATVLMLARRLTLVTAAVTAPAARNSTATGDARQRFVELASANPEQLARVLAVMLNGRVA